MIPGPFRVIATKELSSDASSITLSTDEFFSYIPSGSRHLVLMLNARASSGTPAVYLRFNNDSGSNYHYQFVGAVEDSGVPGAGASKSASVTTSATQIVVQSQMHSTANLYSGGIIIIPEYANTTNHKSTISQTGNTSSSVECVAGRWASTAAITRADFVISSNNFVAGSVAMLAVMDETYMVDQEVRTTDGSVVLDVTGSVSDLTAVYYCRSNRTSYPADSVRVLLSGDTTTGNYINHSYYGYKTSLYSWNYAPYMFQIPSTTGTSNVFGAGVLLVQQAQNGSYYPHVLGMGGYVVSSDSAVTFASMRKSNSISNVTSVEMAAEVGTAMLAGSVASLYKLPRNRTHNITVSSGATSIPSGTITGGDKVIFPHFFARFQGYPYTATQWILLEPNSDTNDSNSPQIFIDYSGTTLSAYFQTGNRASINVADSGDSSVSNVYGGGTVFIPLYDKTDRHKHMLTFSASSCPKNSAGSGDNRLHIFSKRWTNTSAITSFRGFANQASIGYNFAANSKMQIEQCEVNPGPYVPVTTGNSGFFFRFLSIAAPTVGLAAASSYLSWLTNVSI